MFIEMFSQFLVVKRLLRPEPRKAYCLTSAPPAGCTSSSMLRAATELSSLKSIKDNASVRRKLPSVKILRKK